MQKAPGRRPNAELRTREHLTGAEVDRLMEAVKDNRHGHRDTTMILTAFICLCNILADDWRELGRIKQL